jgi:hypothetical protein
VSVLETILLYGVIPLAGIGLIGVLTLVRPPSRGARYRSGGSWDHEPVWWIGNPRGSGVPAPVMNTGPDGSPSSSAPRTARGGARGTW